MRTPAQALAEWVVARITRPRQEYRRYVFDDPERLKSCIRPGDVVLVDGDQRVSQVVKYLTMSPWSHSAIFVGSRFLRNPAQRAATRREFGSESRYLIVEALVDKGVVVSGGRSATVNARRAMSAATRLTADSAASESIPTESVTFQAVSFSAIVRTAAPIERPA